MGIGDFTNWLLGGSATSPSDYAQQYQDRGQILGAVNSGMAGSHMQAPQLDPSQQAYFRQGQQQQIGQLQGIASGQMQGAGELAAMRQAQNAAAMQQAMARMARGPNAALAARNAAGNTAGIGLAGAGMAQQAALGDQQSAQGLLAQALGQGRGQDIGMAGQNAQLQQQQFGMNNQANLGYLSQLTGMDQGQLGAQMQGYGVGQSNPGFLGGLLGAAGNIGSAFALHSDERLKTDVADAGDDIDEMLGALKAKSYSYKDARHGKGRRAGVMAQDLEKTKAGAALVYDAPDGKAIDRDKALSAALAGLARLHERVAAVER